MGDIMEMQRFYIDHDPDIIIKDRTNILVEIRDLEDAAYMLNKLQEELDNLKHCLLMSDKDSKLITWTVGSDLK